MQSLWSLKIDWIDELPSERAKEWHRFLEDFNSVRSICIGRCIVHPQATRVELHGFADASEKCYGAVIYCRSQSPDGATTVKLVTSKSRVAPVKSVTMPRLELCAAVLLAKLMKRVETALQMKTPPVYLWSDSTIVLAWIQKEPNLLKTFVANRVATIQHLTNAEQWHHVSSEQNPADLVSRGLDPFIANCRGEKRRGPLDVQEINQAEVTLIRIVQLQEFKKDIMSLKENNRVSAESLIKSLNPFLDKDDGVLRVGGRLCNSDLNFECKFPVILPCNHKLTNLIVEYFHLKYFHLGPQALLYQKEGRPSLIFSDNGKTFIGANAELKRLYKLVINPDPELAGFLVDENINWKFLPPRAPNFGGLWEAGVKSFKFRFKREAGNSRFTYEEFLTIMTQIEGILNSRPLTACQRI
ncbi:integrase catalytic domain-containing protein [Trichonephila clavipes]|nr:integrase catalytic domain-containing protein [Trichonephila clavipes]